MKKYAVIWCAEAPGDEPLQRNMVSAFGRAREQWDVLHPERADFMARAFEYSGHLISGSPKSVVDDADSPLVRSLLAFLRAAAQRGGMPVIGLCFGAQAIAAALGGEVARNPSGRFRLGVERIDWSAQARALLGPEAAGESTVLVQSHGECVARLPPDSVPLASSASACHEVFLAQERFLGIQGHPEMDLAFLQQKLMVYHRGLFDAAEWPHVQHESRQPLHPARVIALGRRLLDEGRLPAASALRPGAVRLNRSHR